MTLVQEQRKGFIYDFAKSKPIFAGAGLARAIDPDCSCVADSSGACVGRGPSECAGLAVRSVSNRGELAEAVAGHTSLA
jgi:hypothetical protein